LNAWKTDIITGAGAIAFAGFVIGMSFDFPASRGADFGPSLFPRVIAVALILLGTAVLLQSRKGRIHARDGEARVPEGQDILTSTGLRNVIITVAATVVYIAVVEKLGFIPTTAAFLLVLMKAFGLSTARSLVFSCLSTGFVFALFSMVLRVVLP
jgi:putative tricarboxylic transport membrane protein